MIIVRDRVRPVGPRWSRSGDHRVSRV